MITAHCDDEMFFGGQELLIEPLNYEVLCITHNSNEGEFIKIMKELKIKYELWDFKANGKQHIFESNDDKNIYNLIKKKLLNTNYDKIVTHNINGEYGHPQHVLLSLIVYLICKELNIFHKLFNFDLTGKGRNLRKEKYFLYKNNNKNIYQPEIFEKNNTLNEIYYGNDIIEKKLRYSKMYSKSWGLLTGPLVEYLNYSIITKCNHECYFNNITKPRWLPRLNNCILYQNISVKNKLLELKII